jgi:hypothetical protein
MKKTSDLPNDPFSQYYRGYEVLIQKIKSTHSETEFTTWMKEVYDLMQAHFKEIMAFYDNQYQQNLAMIQESHQRYKEQTHNTVSNVQDFLKATALQAQKAAKQYMTNLQNMHHASPNEMFTKGMSEANDLLSKHMENWEALYAKQRKDVVTEFEHLQGNAQRILEDCENSRQEMIAHYKEFTAQIRELLQNKQQEFEDKKSGKN